MAKRGRTRSNRDSVTDSNRPSNASATGPLLRHPSQVLSESGTRKTKSTGPSSITYRPLVLEENKIYIGNYSARETQDIKHLVESLKNVESTLMSQDNNFIENPNDPRIVFGESLLTVSKDIPLRMREIQRRLPLLKFAVEKDWENDVGNPLMAPFKASDEFRVSGGAKWKMLYEPPGEPLTLSTPVPDSVCSISTQPEDPSWEWDVGLERELLKRLHKKQIPYSAGSGSQSIIYPFFILEVKSNAGNMMFAENQVGSSVAIALTLLRRLREEARSDKNLPVFALTSQGSMWKVFISYESTIRGVRCIKICKFLLVDIEDPEDAHKLMVALDRIKQWAINTYLPTIRKMIDTVLASD